MLPGTGILSCMSTLVEIEEAIDRLPPLQVEKLTEWLEERRLKPAMNEAPEPDFLSRARSVWGDHPVGKPLSAVVSEARG